MMAAGLSRLKILIVQVSHKLSGKSPTHYAFAITAQSASTQPFLIANDQI